MTSLRAKLVIGLLRNRHIFQGKFRKEPFKENIDEVLQFREECEQRAYRFGKLAKNITSQPEIIDTIKAEWLLPEKANKDKLIFYVHGGGYVSGSCNDHRGIVSKIAKQTETTTVLYEYGLAPENPFPAALEDSIKVYKAVMKKGYKAENIVMMGESAGGGLCLAILLTLKDKKIPLPKAAVAVSPWTDLTCSAESYKTQNKHSLAPLNSWNVFSHYYVTTNNAKHPYISPLFGNLNGLPSLYLNAGACDELFDDSKRFYEKAKSAGVKVEFKEGKGMIHCYPLLAPMFKEATEAMDEIIMFINHHLNI